MDKIPENSLGQKIMDRPTVHKVDFTITPEVIKIEKSHVSNYFNNPEKNWGPKRAAAIVIPRESKKDRHERENQADEDLEENRKIEEHTDETQKEEKMIEE